MTTDVTRTISPTTPATQARQIPQSSDAVYSGQTRPTYEVEPVEMTVLVDLDDGEPWEDEAN